MKVKVCSACKKERSISYFYKSKRTKDGFRCYCKDCERKKNSAREKQYKERRRAYRQTEKYKQIKRDYYIKNRESINAYNQNWLTKTKNGRMSSYKRGAALRNLEWRLTEEEFVSYWQLPCSYCGSPIKTIGLDRIDSTKGYFVGNVIPCCTTCNKMKMDLAREDFLSHVKKIAEFLNENDKG